MNEKKHPEHVIFTNTRSDTDGDAVSSTECTGLIARAPQSEAELDAYDEIINYSPETINVYNDEKR